MPSYAAGETAPRPPISPAALFGLSPIDRECIANLVGRMLARIEREFIFQILRSPKGNRTRAADRLGIRFNRCAAKSATTGAVARVCLSQPFVALKK